MKKKLKEISNAYEILKQIKRPVLITVIREIDSCRDRQRILTPRGKCDYLDLSTRLNGDKFIESCFVEDLKIFHGIKRTLKNTVNSMEAYDLKFDHIIVKIEEL